MFAWYTGWFDSFIADQDQPVVQRTVEPLVDDSASVEQVADEVVEAVESSEQTPESGIDEVSAEQIINHELVLNFSQTSWVDIRDAEDKRLAYKSYTKGEELIVSNEGRLNVFIGNAIGVTVKYNGEDYDLTPYREGVYAKFVIGLE